MTQIYYYNYSYMHWSTVYCAHFFIISRTQNWHKNDQKATTKISAIFGINAKSNLSNIVWSVCRLSVTFAHFA